jgi:hypothetical protein
VALKSTKLNLMVPLGDGLETLGADKEPRPEGAVAGKLAMLS